MPWKREGFGACRAHPEQVRPAALVKKLSEKHSGMRELGKEALVQLHSEARGAGWRARLVPAPCMHTRQRPLGSTWAYPNSPLAPVSVSRNCEVSDGLCIREMATWHRIIVVRAKDNQLHAMQTHMPRS